MGRPPRGGAGGTAGTLIVRPWRAALHPPLRDPRFWIVQALVVLIAGFHLASDRAQLLHGSPFGASETIGLLLVPIGYAAAVFGLGPSVATALWAWVLWLPDLLLPHDEGHSGGDLVELVLITAVAAFVGVRIERERAARARAEQAEAEQQALRRRLVGAQEDERRRISRELHDEPVQRLVLLSQRLLAAQRAAGQLTPGPADQLVERIGAARHEALDVLGELRALARQLRPPVLDDLGLVAAVRALVAEPATPADRRCTVVGVPGRLPGPVEVAVFRIVQEALRNAERHASAHRIDVQLEFSASACRATVRDDGRGLSADHRPGLGIRGMQERAAGVGAELVISSHPEGGTAVTVSAPARVVS